MSSLMSAELSWLPDRTVLTDRAVLTSSVIEAADDLAFLAEKLRSAARSSETEPRRLVRPVSVLAEVRASLAVPTLLAESRGRGLGETGKIRKDKMQCHSIVRFAKNIPVLAGASIRVENWCCGPWTENWGVVGPRNLTDGRA